MSLCQLTFKHTSSMTLWDIPCKVTPRGVELWRQIIITLRFLATAKMQQCNIHDMGVSQSTVNRVTLISEKLDALSSMAIHSRFIEFPHTVDAFEGKKAEFLPRTQFPGVIFVIDCTHIRTVAPKLEKAAYVNRKDITASMFKLHLMQTTRQLKLLQSCRGLCRMP